MTVTISEHQARVYEFAKAHPQQWFVPQEVAVEINVPGNSVKMHCARFEEIGIFERIRISPSHAFRLDAEAQKHARKMVDRLEEAVRIFGDRRKEWLRREEHVVRRLDSRLQMARAQPAPADQKPTRRANTLEPTLAPSNVGGTVAPRIASISSEHNAVGQKVSKADRLIELISRPGGASIEELVNEFGTQPHSIRATISVKTRERGLKVALVDGRYRVST